jgi:Zinc-finger of C2H2 type
MNEPTIVDPFGCELLLPIFTSLYENVMIMVSFLAQLLRLVMINCLKDVKQMAEEHEARQPYKCAVCGAKFDSQDQLQNHLKSCTQKRISDNL